ncbi:MAG: SAM-dependent methyltransferase, partial [Gammaproteobacteria bacterium]|nr:SAM-dependent methyltransferase [Gammaproteobacteria bacterium]
MFDRKSHWETIYSDKDPLQVSWYQLKPVLSLQFIKNSSVTLDTAFIDIGGGASELVDYLIEE